MLNHFGMGVFGMKKFIRVTALLLLAAFVFSAAPVSLLSASFAAERISGSNKMVYITRTGEKYHVEGCPTIQNSKDMEKMTVSSARGKGYTACARCIELSDSQKALDEKVTGSPSKAAVSESKTEKKAVSKTEEPKKSGLADKLFGKKDKKEEKAEVSKAEEKKEAKEKKEKTEKNEKKEKKDKKDKKEDKDDKKVTKEKKSKEDKKEVKEEKKEKKETKEAKAEKKDEKKEKKSKEKKEDSSSDKKEKKQRKGWLDDYIGDGKDSKKKK